MNGEFWAGRRPGWVAGGLAAAAVAVTAWLLRSGTTGVNVATVLALPVSVASLGAAVWGLVPSPPLSRVAWDLAGRVAQERGRARQQAPGMSADARPADMRFLPPSALDEPEMLCMRQMRAFSARSRWILMHTVNGRRAVNGCPDYGARRLLLLLGQQ